MNRALWKRMIGDGMIRYSWLGMVLYLVAVAPGTVLAADFTFGAIRLTVPDGFEVERIAGPPLVDRPIAAAVDEQGRLYVTDSAGATDKAEKQLQDKPHR